MDKASTTSSGQDTYSFQSLVAHPLKEGGHEPSFLSRMLKRSAAFQPTQFFHFPLTDLPDHVTEETFEDKVNNIPVRYYISRAPVERGVYASCAGMKEGITLNAKRIEQLHERGVSYACLRLMNPGEHRNFMPTYNRYAEYWFIDPESPVHKLFPNLKKFAGGHSTGGFEVLRLKNDPETREQMAVYAQVHGDASFLDTPKSSRHDPWWRQAGFTGYVLICGDKVPEKTYIGNFYLVYSALMNGKLSIPEAGTNALYFAAKETWRIMEKVKKNVLNAPLQRSLSEACFQMPTYPQILEIRDQARRHVDKITKQGIPIRSEGVYIYSDPNDPYSSHLAMEHYASLTGATLIPSKGLHNNLNDDDEAFTRFLETIEADLPPWPEPEVSTEIVVTPQPAQEKGWHILPPLASIIDASRQRGASLLNTATSLFKNAFGRSVGNTEVRGQPERRPVDTGNALRLE